MSDLAPFVAATLHDKVLQELQEEVQRLKQETEPWSIHVTGKGGSPVYATGKLSQREVLQQYFGEEHDDQHVCVSLKPSANGETCNFRQFWEEGELILAANCGRKISRAIRALTPMLENYGQSCIIRKGALNVELVFCGDERHAFQDLNFSIPILSNPSDNLKPLATISQTDFRAENTFSIVRKMAGSDCKGSIRFQNVLLDANKLIALWKEEDDESSEEDDDSNEMEVE